jgi:hypothetical protein
MNKISKWWIIIIGVLFIPPIKNFMEGFAKGWGTTTDIYGWLLAIAILGFGIYNFLSKK